MQMIFVPFEISSFRLKIRRTCVIYLKTLRAVLPRYIAEHWAPIDSISFSVK